MRLCSSGRLSPLHIVAVTTGSRFSLPMFMHDSWSHIIGNMVFLWAFGPEIESAMNPLRSSVFYLVGSTVAMLAQVAASPASTVPSLGAAERLPPCMGAFLITYPQDQIRSLLVIFFLCAHHLYPGSPPHWRLVCHAADKYRPHDNRSDRQGSLSRSLGGLIFGVSTARLFEIHCVLLNKEKRAAEGASCYAMSQRATGYCVRA